MAYCDVHGACILPLIDEMCDYFNVKQEGIHTVRAHAYGLTAEFQYALGESCSLITPTTEPTTEIPTTEPVTEIPTTEPTTEIPTTEAPTTEPVTEVPTTRYDQGDIDWDNMYNDYSQYFPDESTKAPSTTKKSNGQFDFTLGFDVSVESPSNATRPSAVTESSTAKPSDSSTGVFYISNKNYKVDRLANIIYQVEEKNTVEDFLKFFSGVEFCVIDNKGNVCIASDIVATGDKLNLLNPDGSTAVEYEISVLMDVDCNGKISAADARLILRVSATLDRVEGARFKAADVDGNGAIKANDARTTLRRAAGL